MPLPPSVRGTAQGAGTSSLVGAGKGSLKPFRESPKVLVWGEFQEAGQVGARMRLQQSLRGCAVRRTWDQEAQEGVKTTSLSRPAQCWESPDLSVSGAQNPSTHAPRNEPDGQSGWNLESCQCAASFPSGEKAEESLFHASWDRPLTKHGDWLLLLCPPPSQPSGSARPQERA